MVAVIMAGGKGTRLSSVAKDIPKPMVKLAGKSLLEHQVENLKRCGISEIIMIVGYLGDVICDYFKDGSDFGVNIQYYKESKPLGTAGALYFLKDRLKEDFILLFGDLFINVDFEKMYGFHKEMKSDITLFTHPNSHPYDSDIVITENNRVVDWSRKNTQREEDYENLTNAGIYVLSPCVFSMLSENQSADIEKDIIIPNIKQKRIFSYKSTEYVKDIGVPARLAAAEADFRNGICEQRNLKNKQKCIFLDRDGTINRHDGFISKPNQLVLEDGAAEAIKMINESAYLAIVISNQPVIARGECSFEDMNRINNRMHTLLGSEGAYVDDLYFCPHHPDSGFEGEVKELKIKCQCRKPNTGMIMQAVREHNIDLSGSWFIGDTTVDIQTGKNAGLKTALVLTGEAGKDGKFNVKEDVKFPDILSCVKYIIQQGGK